MDLKQDEKGHTVQNRKRAKTEYRSRTHRIEKQNTQNREAEHTEWRSRTHRTEKQNTQNRILYISEDLT